MPIIPITMVGWSAFIILSALLYAQQSIVFLHFLLARRFPNACSVPFAMYCFLKRKGGNKGKKGNIPMRCAKLDQSKFTMLLNSWVCSSL